MPNDNRNLLEVLRSELQFLEAGGYRHATNAPWRAKCIFEDSATCLNFGGRNQLRRCHECVMSRFVPSDCMGEKIPCRHIPLNDAGLTVDTYYRLGTHEETEAAVGEWLRKKIHELQRETNSKNESKI